MVAPESIQQLVHRFDEHRTACRPQGVLRPMHPLRLEEYDHEFTQVTDQFRRLSCHS